MRQFLLCSWKIILFAAGYAVLVILLYRADVPIAIPVAIPAMLGAALSILLGFRTNSAYDRWWEARKIWGAIVNDSRTLGRQVTSLFILPDGASKQDMSALQREMIYRQIAENSRNFEPWSGVGGRANRELEAVTTGDSPARLPRSRAPPQSSLFG